jgi:outer membrane protein
MKKNYQGLNMGHIRPLSLRCFLWMFYSMLQAPCLFAADLLDIYHQALDNDPIFKAAYSTFMAATESIPQARSSLLPRLTIGASASRNVFSVNSGAGIASIDGQQTYDANNWSVNASQSIFNYQAWKQVSQAKASVKAAHATFNARSQDLLLRTAKAYFAVLFAKDTLHFAEAKKRANQRQLEQAQERFNVGLDAVTSVYEAKAAFDHSIAQVIQAENNQENTSENLRKLTDHVYDIVAPLRDNTIPLIKPEPNHVEDWITTGLKQNYDLFAAKFKLQAARENIKAQSGGGMPTLALQGNSTRTNNSGTGNNFYIPAHQMISNVAIALNFPIFQGGLVEANTKQAIFNFQTTSQELEKTYRDVVVNTRIAFNTINDGISKVKADRQTVISQKSSLESTEAQYQVGTRTMVDVVNAQQKLFEAQELLSQDQYELINAILKLKFLAGSLNVDDLAEINSWLQTTRISGLPPKELTS